MEKAARKRLKDHDLVVFGHSHSPQLFNIDDGIYINSGDWLTHNTFLKITNGKAELLKYQEKE